MSKYFNIDSDFEILKTTMDIDNIKNEVNLRIRRENKTYVIYKNMEKINEFTKFEDAQSFIDSSSESSINELLDS